MILGTVVFLLLVAAIVVPIYILRKPGTCDCGDRTEAECEKECLYDDKKAEKADDYSLVRDSSENTNPDFIIMQDCHGLPVDVEVDVPLTNSAEEKPEVKAEEPKTEPKKPTKKSAKKPTKKSAKKPTKKPIKKSTKKPIKKTKLR